MMYLAWIGNWHVVLSSLVALECEEHLNEYIIGKPKPPADDSTGGSGDEG